MSLGLQQNSVFRPEQSSLFCAQYMPVFGSYKAELSSDGYPGYLRKSHSLRSGCSGIGGPLAPGDDAVPPTMPSDIRYGIFSCCCGTNTSVAVSPIWALSNNAVKEFQSAPVSGVLGGVGKFAASGASYARNSGSPRVAQDCSSPIMGLAIEPKKSEINAEANRRLQDANFGERIVRKISTCL